MVYPNNSIQNAATIEKNKITTYINNLNLNEGLYKAITQFAATIPAKQLHPNQQKFLRETIFSFKKNGMRLPEAQRKQLTIFNEKINSYSTLFEKNIAAFSFGYKDSFEFTKEELKGIDSNKLNQWKRLNGKFMLTPERGFSDVFFYAENDTIRHNLFLRFLLYPSPCYPENVKVLDSLLFYRDAMANLLGYRSYATYAMEDKMAATPANVWNLLNGLVLKLAEKTTNELKLLTNLKHQLHPKLPDTLYYWDSYFYKKKLNDANQYNNDEAKEYFEINNTVQDMFGIYEKLFDIRIKEIKHVPVWSPKVKYFELYNNGKKAGSFYMDLYQRQFKSPSPVAYHTQVHYYNMANGKEKLPVSAIVANIKENNSSQPTLLYYNDVSTIFHEFGHLVNALLSRSDITAQTGISTKGNFYEAPAGLMQNWCRHYDSLRGISRHYKTGAAMPESLFNKMINAGKLFEGNAALNGVNDCLVDLTFHDKYDSIKGKDLTEVAKSLQTDLLKYMGPNKGRYIATFGYFTNMGANLYGYTWAGVFAQDMFSVFEKNGIMDTKTGIRYKKAILEKGSSEEEMDMLRNFLGRAPNSHAYLRSLGIK